MRFQTVSKKLKLYSMISPFVPKRIYLDPKRYKQVLFNLIGNAIKFTMKGTIKIIIDCEDNTLITEIQDTGVGINKEDL
jgi:signal transduction histidine kinase